jgi:hypothetical protein
MENHKFYLSKRNNGIYRIGYFVDSKLHWKTTGKRYKAEALSAFNDFEKSFIKPLPTRSLSSFKIELNSYLTQCFQPGTVAIYHTALSHLISIIGDLNIKDVTAKHADTYKTTRLQSNKHRSETEKVKPTTVNCEIRTIRAGFNVALKWGLINQNPFVSTSLSSIADKAPTFFGIYGRMANS